MKEEKPKKLHIKSISVNYGDGKWVDLNENEYQEVIFWDKENEKWDSNSFRLIPK